MLILVYILLILDVLYGTFMIFVYLEEKDKGYHIFLIGVLLLLIGSVLKSLI